MTPFSHLRQRDLIRLAACEVSPRHAQTLRRHLETCARCQAEWHAVQTVWHAAQKNAAVANPPERLRERIFAALPSLVLSERKFVMPSVFVRPVVGASAVAVVVTAALGMGLFYGPALVLRAPRAVAFSDVEVAMANIKTATWAETQSYPNHTTKVYEVTQGANLWARLDPPALLRKSTGYEGEPQGYRTLSTERGILFYSPGASTYDLLRVGDEPLTKQQMRDGIMRSLVFSHDLSEANKTEWLHSPKSKYKQRFTPWKSETTTLDGKSVLRFSRRSTTYRDDTNWWKKQAPSEFDTIIYADPQTYRIVRSELNGAGKNHIRTVSDRFRYNETPPPGTFVLAPSVGETVLLMDSTTTGLYAPVSQSDQEAIKNIVMQAARARNKNDWAAFSRLRDFAYLPRQINLNKQGRAVANQVLAKMKRPPVKEITEQIYRDTAYKNFQKGLPFCKWDVQNVEKASYTWEYLYTRTSEAEAFPPLTPPDLYEAYARVLVTDAKKQTHVEAATFSVAKRPDGFRITAIRFDGPPRKPKTATPHQ